MGTEYKVGPWGRRRAEWGIEGEEHVSMDFGNRRDLIAFPPRHGSSYPQSKPQLFSLKPSKAHIHPNSARIQLSVLLQLSRRAMPTLQLRPTDEKNSARKLHLGRG